MPTSFINYRLLAVSVLGALLIFGGIVGASWYWDRPDYLLRSAEGYYARGEAAAAAGDDRAAHARYESAEKQLKRLLDKEPQNSAAWLLRHKALAHLALLASQREENGQDVGPRPTLELARTAAACLVEAAANPALSEAQALMIDLSFRQDDLDAAVPFAKNLLAQPGDSPVSARFLPGAHFVLARAALNAVPPQPDQALEHLQVSEQLTRAEPPLPRWRAAGLEAAALKMKADEAKGTISAAQPLADRNDSFVLLTRVRIPAWLERARREKEIRTPAAGADPERPLLAGLSPTDTRGLLGVLLLAVELSGDPSQAAERVDLLLGVCETMTSSESPRPHVWNEVVRYLGRLPPFAGARPGVAPAAAEAVGQLGDRIDMLVARALAVGVRADPAVYLGLARFARQKNRLDDALRSSLQGLEAARARQLPADDPQVLELHGDAAWTLVQQHKVPAAEEHLALLRGQKSLAGPVHFMSGLAAAQDGRLEQAVAELKLAQDFPQYRNALTLHLALGLAYLGLGQFDRALPSLLRVQEASRATDQLDPEERAQAAQMLPDPADLDLQLFRCYLGLGQLDQALEARKRLLDKPKWRTAEALLVAAYVNEAVTRRAKEPQAARAVFEAARKEVDTARRLFPRDARLLMAEASLLASQPEANPPLVVSAALGCLTASASPGARVLHAFRLDRGLNWHLEKAEQLLRRETLDQEQKDLEGMLVWVGWLQFRGRWAEAPEVLARLAEVDFPEKKRELHVLRAQLLARKESPDLGPLLRQMEPAGPDLNTDLLRILYLARVEGNTEAARNRLTAALGRQEASGLLPYWQGQFAEADGDYRQAVGCYARALEFDDCKSMARAALLKSLTELSARESPKAANDLVTPLLAAHPRDPVLLLIYAQTAALLDRIGGADGMEKTLAALDEVLRQQAGDPALGRYWKAVCWLSAGRADLAREEVGRALQIQPGHVPSLLLAGKMAQAAEDWDACLAHAEVLARLQPDLPDPLLWRVTCFERLGRIDEARQAGEEVVRQHPKLAAGYMSVVRVLEKSGNLVEARQWVQRCRQRCPEDATALRTQVKLLALADQLEQAAAAGESALSAQLQRLRDEQAEALRSRPPGSDKEREKRQAAEREALTGRELTLLVHVAGGFADAGAYPLAVRWLERAVKRVDRPAEGPGLDAQVKLQLMLGDVYLMQGREERNPVRRAEVINKAIDAYATAHQLAPGDLVPTNNLAWLLCQERKDVDGAFAVVQQGRLGRYSQKVLGGDRLPLDFLDTFGVVACASGHYQEAVKVLEAAAGPYAREPGVFLHLARAYIGLKDFDRAAENVNKAMRLARERAEAARDTASQTRWRKLVVEADTEAQRVLRLRP
jgi:Tfp pilus assembly protein PilF